MCLSPDEMKSSELEALIKMYRAKHDDYWSENADMLQEILDERKANGTYNDIPEVTPRHITQEV